MISFLIGADWGEHIARRSKYTAKGDNLSTLREIWVWKGGRAIGNAMQADLLYKEQQ